MGFIEHAKWRYATKVFDTEKEVSHADLKKIKEGIQLSASSFGLQLYKVYILKDKTLREKLKQYSWNQQQITQASHLFVFCNYMNGYERQVEDFIKLQHEIRSVPKEKGDQYKGFILHHLSKLTPLQFKHWTAKQTYIAMANLLSICAELRIDACPMEGFDATYYDQILGLESEGLTTSVVVPVGYRAQDDQAQFASKVRKPIELLFEEK